MINAIDFYLAIKKGRYAVFIATTRGRGGGGGGGNCSTALAIGNPEKGAGGGGWGRQQTWGNKMI